MQLSGYLGYILKHDLLKEFSLYCIPYLFSLNNLEFESNSQIISYRSVCE